MKRPWMPLYIGDYLANTGHLTTLQHGIYLLLIMHYWECRGLPNKEDQLLAIARITPEIWCKNRDVIAAFFGDNWVHERLEQEFEKLKSLSKKRASAGHEGGKRKHRNSKAKSKQLLQHSHTQKNLSLLVDRETKAAAEKFRLEHGISEEEWNKIPDRQQ